MRADTSNLSFAVSQIQQWLQFLSRVDDKLTRVNPDGVYGTETEAAVRQFQLTRSLIPTGTVDFTTWQRLKQDYAAAMLQLQKTYLRE